MTLRYQNKSVENPERDIPAPIWDLLWSPVVAKRISAIMEENNLSEKQQQALRWVVHEVILQNIAKNRVRFEVQKQLDVPEGTAVTITDDIQKALSKATATLQSETPASEPTAKESPLPEIDIKSGPPKPTPPPKPPSPEKTAKEEDTLPQKPTPPQPPDKPDSSTTAPSSSSSSAASERPSIPLPEDKLTKTAQKTEQQSTADEPPQATAPKGPSPAEKPTDSYREPVKEDAPKSTEAPKKAQPVPETPEGTRENLGPLIDGNIIDLRE